MQKVIVTGGLGFIGSNLIEYLISKKLFVINIDRVSYASNYYNVRDFKNDKRYKFVKCDIRDKNKLINLCKRYKPNAIFNLAAETHVDRSIDSPKPFIENNIDGVFSLLEAVRKYSKINKKFKLIHISTDEVYGDILKGRSKEFDKYIPSSPYAASKASSDHLVGSYIRTFKLPAIVTNCSNNYGPRQHPEKLIPKMIYNILNNKPLPIYGKGTNSREWIYVKDHCEALFKVFLKGKTGEFYNIGSNKNLNNLQVTNQLLNYSKTIIDIGDRVKIVFVKDRPGHDIRYALNSNKIKKNLGWYPKIDFKTGIKLTLKWYFENKSYYKSLSKKDIINRLGRA